jgi:LysM repeat protein
MASLGLTGLAKELNVGIWVAAYPNSEPQGYSQPSSPIEGTAIYQYASTGHLDGYADNLDLNVFYGDTKTWAAYVAGGERSEASPTPAPVPPSDDVGTIERIAQEVIDGKWGNGGERMSRLTAAGYDYRTIQESVNKTLGANISSKSYTVKAGDTLSGIASKHNTTYQAVAELNGISNPNLIYSGQTIRLP